MPTISQLPAATQVNSADLFAIVQTGITKKATQSLVTAAVSSGITITESQVTGLTTSLAAKMDKASNLSDVTSVPTSRINLGLPALTDGQLWIGNTGLNPSAANLTAGTNISITNAGGLITINATGMAGIGWSNVTGASQVMVADNGYVANNAGLVTFTLPATAAFGTIIYVQGLGAGGWQVNVGIGQTINVGNTACTISTGNIASTNQFDSIALLCVTANTTWCSLGGPQGTITIV